MLELHVADTKINRGAVQVTWCVDRETLRSLEGQPGEAFLLIISAPMEKAAASSAQVRKLVPLSDGTAFVGFRRPGTHYVWGMILVGDRRRIADFAMRRTNGYYESDIIANASSMPHNDLKRTLSNVHIVSGPSARIEIEVPEACFAQKPPEWLAFWASWVLGRRGDDQCSFRRRLIFAFSIQTFIIFPLYLLVRIVQGIALLSAGIPGVNYRALFLKPFSYEMDDAMQDSKQTVFQRRDLPWWLQLLPYGFMPAIIAVFTGFAYVGGYNEKTKIWAMSLKHAFLYGVGLSIGLAVAATLVMGAIAAVVALFGAKKKAVVSQPPKGEVRFEETTLDALACGDRANESGLGNPSFGRRIVLIYENAKANICRPFSS